MNIQQIILSSATNTWCTDIKELINIISMSIGIIVPICTGVVSFVLMIRTNSVELSFMTKKEQIKFELVNYISLIVVLWVFHLVQGLNGYSDDVDDTYDFISIIEIIAGIVCIMRAIILKRKSKNNQMCKFFSILLLSGASLYNIGYTIQTQYTSYRNLVTLSIIIAIFDVGLIFLLCDLKLTERAEICFHDPSTDKVLYLLMKYKENLCLAGDKAEISDCSELYLRSLEDLKKVKLLRTVKNPTNNIKDKEAEKCTMDTAEKEILHNWNYFCSLCKRLDSTRQYVDHSTENNVLKNNSVNSFEFQQLIILASIEFENICKQICLSIDSSFNVKNANIKQITLKILERYPNIGQTEIMSDYQTLRPLQNWGTHIDNSDNNKIKVKGIEWWDDYGNIKHRAFLHYELATLENAIKALASLMVLELYYMKIKLNSVKISMEKKCDYFGNNYTGDILCTKEKGLPDFEIVVPTDATTLEVETLKK